MSTATDFHKAASHALSQGDPVRALDLLDQPWMLGLPVTPAEARANLSLEERARDLDRRQHAAAGGHE